MQADKFINFICFYQANFEKRSHTKTTKNIKTLDTGKGNASNTSCSMISIVSMCNDLFSSEHGYLIQCNIWHCVSLPGVLWLGHYLVTATLLEPFKCLSVYTGIRNVRRAFGNSHYLAAI